MATLEELVSPLEGGFEHLATKADLAELRGEMNGGFANLKTRQAEFESRMLRWLIGMVGTATAAVVANIAIDLITR